MVKKVQLIRYLFLVSIILFGCSKETVQLSKYQQEQNSINELRKIVGNNGKFEVLPKNFNFNSSNIKSESLTDSSTLSYLSLSEFKQLYESIGKYQYERVIETDSNSSIKTMDFDDKPGRPGLHRIQYYSFPYNVINGTYGINEARSPLTTLNLWF